MPAGNRVPCWRRRKKVHDGGGALRLRSRAGSTSTRRGVRHGVFTKQITEHRSVFARAALCNLLLHMQ